MSQPSTSQQAASTITNGLRDGRDMALYYFSKTFDHPMKGVQIHGKEIGTTLTWVRIPTITTRHNKWDTARRGHGDVIVLGFNKGRKGPAILKTRTSMERPEDFANRNACNKEEDRCRLAFMKGARELPQPLRQYHSNLCTEASDPQRRESYDLILHICEEAKQGNGTGHEGVVQWFDKANMLKATSRLFERKFNEASQTEYNLHDHCQLRINFQLIFTRTQNSELVFN